MDRARVISVYQSCPPYMLWCPYVRIEASKRSSGSTLFRQQCFEHDALEIKSYATFPSACQGVCSKHRFECPYQNIKTTRSSRCASKRRWHSDCFDRKCAIYSGNKTVLFNKHRLASGPRTHCLFVISNTPCVATVINANTIARY